MATTTTHPLPVVPAAMTRGLGRTVLLANCGATAAAAVVGIMARPADYWPALAAGISVGTIGAFASVMILSQAAGKTVDWLITYLMGASAARLFVSLTGLLVAVKAFGTPPALTAVFVCLFFVITLGVESVRLHAALGRPDGESHA